MRIENLTRTIASTTYGAVARTLQYLSDRAEQPRPDCHTVQYKYPTTNDEVLAAFRAKIWEIKQQNPGRQFNVLPDQKNLKQGNRFVAVIDAISSMPAVLLPWKKMVQVCKEEGVWSVIDAAHSIGQEVRLFVEEVMSALLLMLLFVSGEY